MAARSCKIPWEYATLPEVLVSPSPRLWAHSQGATHLPPSSPLWLESANFATCSSVEPGQTSGAL